MAGLYIHIPFCASRCIYCNFYSTVGSALKQRYVDAVCREMELRARMAQNEEAPDGGRMEIETVYFGGGTPSQLTTDQLRQLFEHIGQNYLLSPHPEVTLEVNPDDVTVAFAEALPLLGVNRVSMGAQTFDDQRLRFLHRRHTAAQVPQAVGRLRKAGIRNISIDLMYGFPGETPDDWQHDIDAVLALDVEHLSAYCLMIEEGTALYEILKMKDERLMMMDEETERQMYETLIDRLTAAGYEHYEISNFSKLGYRSRHNSSYWHDVPYIGLGAAAHSMEKVHKRDGSFCVLRSWNVSDLLLYVEAIERGKRPSEQEVLDDDTRYNDRITVALRTCDGLDLTTLSDRHRHYCLKEALPFLDDGLLRFDGHRIMLTRKGLFVSDMVMAELMLV